jgi:hypothetical protein
MATPRFTQKLGSRLEGRHISHTKLVEWPVVLSTPRRSLVLYSGQLRGQPQRVSRQQCEK